MIWICILIPLLFAGCKTKEVVSDIGEIVEDVVELGNDIVG